MMDGENISLEEQRALMRHEDIRTTLAYGGKSKVETEDRLLTSLFSDGQRRGSMKSFRRHKTSSLSLRRVMQ